MLKAVLARKKEREVTGSDAKAIIKIIKDGLFLLTRIEVTKEKLKENNKKFIPFADKLVDEAGILTATYKSEDGTITAKYTQDISYDEKDMPKVKKILGPLFSQIFHEVTMFAVNPESIPEIQKKLGADFDRLVAKQSRYKHTSELKTLLCNGDSETARKLRDIINLEVSDPTISYEKTPVDTEVTKKSKVA